MAESINTRIQLMQDRRNLGRWAPSVRKEEEKKFGYWIQSSKFSDFPTSKKIFHY